MCSRPRRRAPPNGDGGTVWRRLTCQCRGRAEHGWHDQRDQSVLARAPTVPRVPRRSTEPSEDVSELHGNGSVVSQLRADSPRSWLGNLRRKEKLTRRVPNHLRLTVPPLSAFPRDVRTANSTPSAMRRGRSPIPRTSASSVRGSTSMTFV
jgi:hypothetical protein